MIAIVTILLAFPLGWFVRSTAHARLAYAVAYLWAFTYQGVYLLVDSLNRRDGTFEPQRFPWDYGLVSLLIFAVGFGLVEVGSRWRRHRDQAATHQSTPKGASA